MSSSLDHLSYAIVPVAACAGFRWLQHLSAGESGRAPFRACGGLMLLVLATAMIDVHQRGAFFTYSSGTGQSRLATALIWLVPLAGIVLGGTILFTQRAKKARDSAMRDLLDANARAREAEAAASDARLRSEALQQRLDQACEQAEATRLKAEEMQRVAQEARRSKTQFLGNFSHEIRAPLSSVIGTVELLSRTKLDDPQDRYVRMASTASQSLLELISDVIDLSVIETGEAEFESLDVDLRDLLRQLSDANTPLADKKGLRFQAVVAPQVPSLVRGDPTRLLQILMNLCTNALKFTVEGGVFVRAVLDREMEDSVEVRFVVTDTGMGIPDNRINCLFTPFSQVEPSAPRRFGGSGLGLAICRSLVSLMGGQIGVESEAGRGSTFWFTIPFKYAARTSTAPVSTVSVAEAKVLVVGESPEENAVLGGMLSSASIHHAICGSIDELPAALTGAGAVPAEADLVILRCGDSSTAIEVLEGLRGMFGETGPALLAITDDADTEAAAAARAAGVTGVISQPLCESGLLDAIVMSISHGRPVSSVRLDSASHQKRRWSGVRVLIAENNEVMQAVLTQILGEERFACIVAVNGEEAVARALTGEFDLLLMDCQMPVCDGYEATQIIRAAETRRERTCRHASRLPILGLAATSLPEDRNACLAAGMDDFLTKPIDIRSLMNKITTLANAGGWLPKPVGSTLPPGKDMGLRSLARVAVNSAAFEGDRLAARCGHNLNLMRAVLERYSRNAHRMLGDIELAIATESFGDLPSLARSMRMSSENVGAVGVFEAAMALELASQADQTAQLSGLFASLHQQSMTLFGELPVILKSLGGDLDAQAA